jgi:hypothetical protein
MALYPEDRGGAFLGLIGGSVVVALVLYTIVHFTNRKFEGHKAAAAGEVAKPK